MYSAQTMKNKFNLLAGMMGEEEDDGDQDSVKEVTKIDRYFDLFAITDWHFLEIQIDQI